MLQRELKREEETRMKTFKVVYERDEEGWWVASIPDVPGCHTQGRTIRQARGRIREALSLYAKGASRARLVDDQFLIPPTVLPEGTHDPREAARRLVGDPGRLSTGDAAKLLGLAAANVRDLLAA